MSGRPPLLPTLLVAAAVSAMLALGVWQLGRAAQKDRQIARYEAAQALSSAVAWPRSDAAVERALYRHSRILCERVLERRATAGRNLAGELGWAQVARCALDGGGEAEVVLGWARSPRPVRWDGGEVLGIVAPSGRTGARLVAAPPLAGLTASAPPDPRELPNNHAAYAVQWFFFAATAAAIYVLAWRKRRSRAGAGDERGPG